MKLVSVIIPYYKKKKYIGDALKSVLKQTYDNLEILIIYDDPDKEDLSHIKNLSLSDQRIKLIINDKNVGAGKSRNIGIENSNGHFIAFLDADDEWKSNKIEEQLKFMLDNKIDFSHTSYTVINEQNDSISFRKAKNFFNLEDLIKSCDIGLSSVLLSKETLKSNKFPDLKTKEDFVLWLKLLESNIKIYGLDKNLSNWRKSKNSLSSSSIQKILDGYRVYNSYMKFNMFKSVYYLLCLSLNYLKKN